MLSASARPMLPGLQLEVQVDERVLLQVRADGGRVDDRLDADRAQVVGGADPGQLEDLRGVEAAAADDDVAGGRDALDGAAARELDAGRAAVLDDHAVDERAGQDLEVLRRAAQEGRRGVPAPAVLLGHLAR